MTDQDTEDLKVLRKFAAEILSGFPEDFGDIDSFDLQELALVCGLLKSETKTVPCGENCNCAQFYYEDGEETDCYSFTDTMKRAMK